MFCWIVVFVLFRSLVAESTQPTLSTSDKLLQIEQILLEHNHFQNAQCGSFKEQYLSRYDHLIQQPESQKKYLISIPHTSGIADRILGICTAFTFAVLSNRIFQIGLREPLHPMEQPFTPSFINWTRGFYDPPWILEPLHPLAAPQHRNYNASILESHRYFAVNTILDDAFLDRFMTENISNLLGAEFQSTFITLIRGRTVRIFDHPHYAGQLTQMGLTPYNTFGCFVDFLFTPKPHIFLPLWPLMQQLHQYSSSYRPSPRTNHTHSTTTTNTTTIASSTLVIAIHIRVGDDHLRINDQAKAPVDHFSAFFSCAEQIERFSLRQHHHHHNHFSFSSKLKQSHQEKSSSEHQFTKAVWFLITDSVDLRKAAVKKYGAEKLLTSLDAKVEHSAKEICPKGEVCQVSDEGFETAVAEWWLMSFARYHVISAYSGFGRSAAVHSLFAADSIYNILDYAHTPHCSKTAHVTRDYLAASQHSGVSGV